MYIKKLLEKWNESRSGRSLRAFNDANGGLLAQGMAYTAIFSVFAGVYVLTAISGIIFQSSDRLKDALITFLSTAIPGLIDTGNGGAINQNDLFNLTSLSVSGLIVLALLIWTTSGLLTTFRTAMAAIFRQPKPDKNFLLLKLGDLLSTFGVGLIIIVSMIFSVLGTRALSTIMAWLSFDFQHQQIALNLGSLAIALLLDTLAIFLLFFAQARVPVQRKTILLTSFVGAIGYGALKWAGATLALGGGSNPLLQSFLVIIGLLVWFNLVMQWMLLLGAWMATGLLKKKS